MVRVRFTANLKRHVSCPDVQVPGATVGEALEHVFAEYPALRGYLLDERGEVRRHVVIFCDGGLIRDRRRLSDPVGDNQEIYVFQALSGG